MLQKQIFIATACIVIAVKGQNPEQEMKRSVQQRETEVRENVELRYGQNTEKLTFSMTSMTDFLVGVENNVEVKATMHTYWRQDNIYISSEYREGENMRVLVYEDNYRIILDQKFYSTWGFKFNAEKGKDYTVRFIDEGKIPKLISMEMSKATLNLEEVAKSDDFEKLSNRLATLEEQMKMMSSISEFGIVLHEQEASKLNHSTCLYMTYLLGESAAILLIVGFQVKYMSKLLKSESII